MKLKFNESVSQIDNLLEVEALKKYKTIIYFGAGNSGTYFYEHAKEHQILPVCFCDNYKAKIGTIKKGLPVYDFMTAINKYPDSAICITSIFTEEISQQIIKYDEGLKGRIFYVMKSLNWETSEFATQNREKEYIEQHIEEFEKSSKLFEDDLSRQVLEGVLNYRLTRNFSYIASVKSEEEVYFDLSIIDFKSDNRVLNYLDGGSFNGDSVEHYLRVLGHYDNKSYQDIYCFEPDPTNFKFLSERIKVLGLKNIKLYESGLFSFTGNVKFTSFAGEGSKIEINKSNDSDSISVIAFDDLKRDNIGFIKLDIEGSEREALVGMKETIKAQKPILAICAYHLQDDLIHLPRLIKEMNPNYKLYLRQYMLTPFDTVIYAI